MFLDKGHASFDKLLPILLLGLLALGCLVVLQPFLTAVLWACILAYSSWPAYLRVHRTLGSRQWAAAVMTLAVAAVIILPAVMVGSELVENSAPVLASIQGFLNQGLPAPPSWVGGIPVIGPSIAQYMAEHANDASIVSQQLREFLGPAQGLILNAARTIAAGLLELVLSVLIAFFFYRDGAFIARRLQRTLHRVGGARALQLLGVAGATIKGVVYGILGTALAQGALAMIGFLIVQVQGALFLGFLTFFMSLLPMGPPLVWVPVVIWLGVHERIAAAVFLAVWGVFVISGVDNLLKPYLISRAGSLPFILVLLGAFGGVLAFGLIGVFLGPVLLALTFNLVLEWSGAAPVGHQPAALGETREPEHTTL
jgi:predicted PurR-regulated permease PerM